MRHSLREKIVISKHYLEIKEYLKELPDFFMKRGKVIYQGRNTIKTFDVNASLCINVKSFKMPHLFNQFVYATFRKSKAYRSYHYAKRLIKLGIDTPDPIAYMEFEKPFRVINSLYVSKHIDFDDELRVLKKGTVEEHIDLIIAFANYTAMLHSLGILHIDYSPGNILFKKENSEYKFYLVDLNRMVFDKNITAKIACKNFSRLNGSDEMITLFVKEYAKIRRFDVKICLSYTFKYRSKFWGRFQKKYPEASPYIESV